LAYTPALARLIQLLGKMPGIGEKSAARLAFFILRGDDSYAHDLAAAVDAVKRETRFCSGCHALTEADPCDICRDPKRDQTVLCVVEEPSDVFAVERAHNFRGRYHVLHGAISPLDGRGPEQLRIKELIFRLHESADATTVGSDDKTPISEVVIATNPTVEGEATAVYLARLIKPLGISVSRIAYGIPVGGNLEYVDQATIGRALKGRQQM
jgi:recombination protein RecR